MSDILKRLKSYREEPHSQRPETPMHPAGLSNASCKAWVLSEKKWKEIEVSVILQSSFKKILLANYLLKVGEIYFCGNDFIFTQSKNKKVFFFWDLLAPIKMERSGNWQDYQFWELLRISLACLKLGATVESWRKKGK